MKIHYFQRYHSKENVHTSNAMLLLSRLYQYSPSKFCNFLTNILPDNADIELTFRIQDKISGGTVPDATISQASFKVAIETKLGGDFSLAQLKGHIGTFKNEDYKVLLTLDPSPMRATFKTKLNKFLSEQSQSIAHKHLTFDDLINQIDDAIDERDYEMKDVLEDYREYCYSSGLIPKDWKRMRVQLAGTTLAINKKLNVYYDNVERGFSGHQYLGLYNQKSVRAVGKIYAIAVAALVKGKLDVEEEVGTITSDMEGIIRAAIEDAKNYGYSIHNGHRYFFIEKFYETDFKKTSKGAPMGSRMFDLCEVLDTEELPKKTEEIAELLKSKNWQ
ncbi:MAG: hypothetical protein FWF76_02010 [Oscillospiraceae bacterium]|nr:hypothetical protein [Oscillospiraceae bacterium]